MSEFEKKAAFNMAPSKSFYKYIAWLVIVNVGIVQQCCGALRINMNTAPLQETYT